MIVVYVAPSLSSSGAHVGSVTPRLAFVLGGALASIAFGGTLLHAMARQRIAAVALHKFSVAFVAQSASLVSAAEHLSELEQKTSLNHGLSKSE